LFGLDLVLPPAAAAPPVLAIVPTSDCFDKLAMHLWLHTCLLLLTWNICSQMHTHAYAWPAHCTPLAGQHMEMSSVLDGRHARIVFSGATCKYAHALELMWCEAYTTTQGRHSVLPLLSGSAVWTLRAPLAGVTSGGPRNVSVSRYARALHARPARSVRKCRRQEARSGLSAHLAICRYQNR
jgi:hypothetical protein